jgi:sialate O-acetylesterase
MTLRALLAAAIAVVSLVEPLRAEVKPNSLFTDNAVLQRDAAVPVFGTAGNGEKVTVEFGGQKISTTAKDGKWRVTLKAMKANTSGRTMTVRGDNVIQINNVLVGDVWVASGQSNMERQLGLRSGQKPIDNWQAEAETADYPEIRQYYVPLRTASAPVTDANGKWIVCTPGTAPDFSAVGFFFARDVHEAEEIPVGILFTAWGGTPAESWASADALKTMPEFKQALETTRDPEASAKKYKEEMAKWYADNDAGSSQKNDWSAVSLDTGDWTPVEMPAMFPEDFDGVVWYRKEIELPESWAGKTAVLRLGTIDDKDTTWINGVQVGAMKVWSEPRNYKIPSGVLKSGRNVIAIRVLDTYGPGGFREQPQGMKLELAEKAIAPIASSKRDSPIFADTKIGTVPIELKGVWHSHTGLTLGKSPWPPADTLGNQNSPAVLYNAMIAPLQQFPIKGAIWYQGESNSGRAGQYLELFPLMIADWRRAWGVGDFPFLFVQIAPHKDMNPEIREAQLLTLAKSPNTAMAVIVDAGDAEDIHPARKQPVGARLALAARALAYGEKIEYSGPLFKSMRIDGNKAVISFTHVGGGLVAKDGPLKGFVIAGADKKFVPASAEIKGDSVIVWSDDVASPKAVRYGWANVPEVNLFNSEGLPASPFRTDVSE